MKDKIKWKKLKAISESIAGRPVTITLTTAIDDERKAVAVFNDDNANIVINGNMIKEVEDVIDGVSHELAHIVIGSSEHNDDFTKKWNDIFSIVKIKYNRLKKRG